MGFKLFTDRIENISIARSKNMIINTLNPHSYAISKKDNSFESALKESDILLPDGDGIVLAAKLNGSKMKKIAGADIHFHLLKELQNISGRCFYLGSTNEVLELIKHRLKIEFKDIQMDYYSPPFKEEFDSSDNDLMVQKVNSFRPDVVFIGMTAPKQEKWLSSNASKMEFNIAASIGAVFDFYAGSINRPSDIWIKLKMEWLVRFLKEPRRLWKRVFISGPIFIWDCVFSKREN